MAKKEARAARHNGRGGKHGAYSAKHSDRNFDISETKHIDPTLAHLNIHRRYAGEFEGAKTNEEYELAFYAAHFGESLERKNAGYKAKGKANQIKTMEEYHRSMKSCPEETYYTAGEGVDRELLWQIYSEHQAWKAERFPLCQTLTADLHADEPGAMLHIHERSVWIGHDAKGMEVVGQAKALAEMGVERPDPSKKAGKHNNAKQTFTRECRENFIELCRVHGLEIITEAKPSGEVGLDLMEYKIQHAQQRKQEAQAQLEAIETRLQEQQAIIKRQDQQLEAQNAENARLRAEMDKSKAEAEKAIQRLSEARGRLLDIQEDIRCFEGRADALKAAIIPSEHLDKIQARAKKALLGGIKLSEKDYEFLQQSAAAAALAQALDAEVQQLRSRLAAEEEKSRKLALREWRNSMRMAESEHQMQLLQKDYDRLFQENQFFEAREEKMLKAILNPFARLAAMLPGKLGEEAYLQCMSDAIGIDFENIADFNNYFERIANEAHSAREQQRQDPIQERF